MRTIACIAVLVAAAGSQVGCATIFSGTSDEVVFDCEPAGAICAVIGGGGVGGLLVTAAQANVGLRAVLELIEPHVSPESREKLRKVDFNELVAAVVMRGRTDKLPPELVAGVGEIIEKLPKKVIRDIMDALGIQEVGASPMEVKLKKGRPWGVLCFAPGYKARIELVGIRFNAVTLLNVFNLFIGCGIDVLTGAMFGLEEKVRIRLEPRRPG